MLDTFQRDASINTLFLATFTYGRGIAGRQIPGQPLPDHGKQQYDTDTFRWKLRHSSSRILQRHGLSGFARPRFRRLRCARGRPPYGGKRGIKTICWFEDVSRESSRHRQLQEKELTGKNATNLCFNNPNYRNCLLGMVED